MKLIQRYKKFIAAFLLVVFTTEMFMPNVAYALTSGPAQPEMKGFEPIGNSDMVDLFSGDFSYNIPLMDVGGYPVNLAYHSGAGMDDEASWVGYGWGLNAGSLNRNLRGIPDDFNGTDKLEREMSMKDHKTYGGKFSMTLDLLGIPKKKIKAKVAKKKKLDLSLTISIGVKNDNYRGIGMEIGLNPGVSLTDYSAKDNTAKDADGNFDLDSNFTNQFPVKGGLSLSSQDGASIDINADMLIKNWSKDEKQHSLSKSIGFGYNTRSGLSGMTIGSSFSTTKKIKDDKGIERTKRLFDNGTSSFLSFNGDTYTPTIDHSTRNNSFTFSLHLGPELWVAFPGLGLTGFYSKQTLTERVKNSPAYGFLHNEKGKDNQSALMDFNREKDIPYSSEVKYLPLPVPSYDLFSATSQDGGGQYRLFRGSSGVFFDQHSENTSSALTLGIEAGAGTYFDVGADLYKQDIKSISKKWTDRNLFLTKGDFQSVSVSDPAYEPAYFKRVGEPVPYDNNFILKIKGTSAVAVSLPAKIDNVVSGAKASDLLRTETSKKGESISVLKRDKREVRNTTFSYLTAKEAANHGLDKTIKDFHPDSVVISGCTGGGIKSVINRTDGYRRGHHFSEVTVTGDDGKQSIYGIPVYNTYQEEVTFSVTENLSLRNKGLINYSSEDNSISNKKGRENYYSREKTPPYATSYLLSSILSPDYVDRTGNGITDDDLGTAVKFNYTKLNSLYKWRTPFAFGADTANYNEGFISDALDDKANYVYGEKEIWYLHSIESKTMVAHFVTEDRLDGLGVSDNRGAVNSSVRLKRLKEIKLYSKSDLRLNGNDPAKTIPIKTVHFEYDYSICKGLPNSIGNTGKLTLKRIFFTFGLNQKGKLNPYDFQYDTTYNFYNYRQYDRWGNFKDAANNPNGLNNSEFPYTLQDTAWTNKFARAWQLNKIILPSGGSININYESDDYAYVQDRRASQMCMLNGVGSTGQGQGLISADYIYVNLPYPVANNQELRERYFEGITNLYYKFLIDLDAKGHKEFVPGYAELDPNLKPELAPGTNNVAKIKLKKIKGVNPIAKASWQFIRTNLTKYAYPGSENLESSQTDLGKAIKALVTAFGTIKELFRGFEKRAKNKGYSNNVDLSKSWVRLGSPEWKKLGGGSRVKRVDISDNWANMSGTAGAQTSIYSQLYDYTTKDAKKRIISSGVASYEPMLGNDENPFRQPIRYKQGEFLGLNNYYYIEEPFGESFFPAATVGYGKVTVKTIGTGDPETVNRTGIVVSEFFTAKEYPTKVDILGLEDRKPITDKIFKLIGGVSFNMVGLSQGYSVETNDMHGKPKSVQVYNKSGQKISSVDYFYKSVNELAARKDLKNDVKVIHPDGTVTDGTIGMDVEMFTDMRQQTTDNLGVSLKVSGGSGAILIFPLPFFFPGIGVNYDRRNFRSSSTIKIINRFAIQYKVVKMENGSTITSENLLWDSETGNTLLTKTQNEFDDPVFSFAYPAHWKYDGMGQAYKNLGTVLTGFSTGASGTIVNGTYNNLLTPGDELIDVNSSVKYWVINSPVSSVYAKRIINADGELQTISNSTLKLLRSGRRNMANTAIATIATLKNPVIGDKLDVSQLSKVLDAKATVFNEEWSVPVPGCATCPDGYSITEDGTQCYKDTLPIFPSAYRVCEGDQIEPYSSCGTYQYYCFGHGGILSRARLGATNPFWNAFPQHYTQYCNYDATNTMTQDYGIYCPQGRLINNKRNNEILHDTLAGNNIAARDPNFSGPLNRTGIWACGASGEPVNVWLGFERTFNITESKTYYLGIGCDNEFRVLLNGSLVFYSNGNNDPENFKLWHIFPLDLVQGAVTLKFEAKNSGAQASFGAELYNNTLTQLDTATSYNSIDTLFSTANMVGQYFNSGDTACVPGYTKIVVNGTTVCRKYVPFESVIINPYYTGILGNWRPKSSYVYQVSRENLTSDPAKFGSTDIRKSGAYSVFSPFWSYSSGVWNQSADTRWIAANEMTYFNQKGLEVENKDALKRYSSALFGYLESMPVAVASNTRYRELAYDGFEDYGFALDCNTDTCSSFGHFSFRKLLNGGTINTTGLYAHSGKFSLALNGSVTLSKSVYTSEPASVYSFDNGRYKLESNELVKGFSPVPGKKYVLSFWMNDGNPRDATSAVQASVNGTDLLNSSLTWPVVEGWKRVEAQFVLPSVATNFILQLQSGGGTVYVDDVRIHPFDGQMKSFAYDPSSQRLWAEMDENNFATFYEYDDEGILIRVKKETERGIMTIKETRSSYRKRQ
jgi:hypothetical protein